MRTITSLMVCTYNRLELTKKMIDSLFANTDQLFRLIVVDNGSEDGTPEWLTALDWKSQKNCVGFELQLNPTNRGIAVGRNQCLKIANRFNDPYLSTLDNDIAFTDGWLGKCLDVISANKDYVVGLNMEPNDYPIQTLNGKTFKVKRVGNLGTACTVFRRELHQKIGYFITQYGLYACEDSDFFFRARCVGYKMGYLSEPGKHLGEGAEDTGHYRAFKDSAHADAAPKFIQSCGEYATKKRPLYIDFSE